MGAKKPGDGEFDDFGLDDELDMGPASTDDGMSLKDDRKAVTIVATSFASGAKDYLMDPRRQKEFIKKSLPPGYSAAFDTVDTGTKFAKELYDTATEELKPLTDSAKKILDKTLPKDGQYKPGGLVEKLAKWSRNKQSSGMSEDETNEAAITTGLADIFKVQAEEQAAKDRTENAERKVDRAIQMKMHGGTLAHLQQIAGYTGRLAAYQDQVLVKFQQKQLELNYRQYFVQRQLLTTMRDHAAISKDNLLVIAKNTGLPDFVKMRNTEVVEQVLKTSTIAALGGKARDWFAGSSKRLLSRYKAELREFASSVGMVLESAGNTIEMGQAMEEAGIDRRTFAMEMAGSGLGQAAAGKLTGKLSEKLLEMSSKNPKLVNWGLRIANMNRGIPQMLLDWVRDRDPDGEGWLSKFLNLTKEGLGDFKKDTAIRTSAADKLDEAVHFNLQTRQTLVEVIPGWLSRIHNELRMTRTGDDSISPMKYSFESGTFEETRQAYKGVIKRVFDKSKLTSSTDKLREMMAVFDGADLTDAEKAALTKMMFEGAYDTDVGLSVKKLLEDDGFEGVDDSIASPLKQKMRNYFGVSYTETLDRNGKVKKKPQWDMEGPGQSRLSQLNSGFASLQEALPDFQDILQKEMQRGNQDALMDLGLIEYDESTMTWNMKEDFFREAVLDQFKRLTPEQQAKPGVWSKVIREVMGKLQDTVDGKGTTRTKTKFATGGHVRSRKLRGKFPNKRKDLPFRRSGLIDGPGTGTSDSIDIQASDDEFIVRAQTTRQPGALGFLKDFNRRGMAAVRAWSSRFKQNDDFVGPLPEFVGPMPQSLSERGLSALRGWGAKAREGAGNAKAFWKANSYDPLPDDGRNMGPVAPGGIKKRTMTDIYELLDHWAPFWGSNALNGGINALGRLGARAKGMLGRFNLPKLKSLGDLVSKENIKQLTKNGLSAGERLLDKLKAKLGPAGEWISSGINKVKGAGTWLKDRMKTGVPALWKDAKGLYSHHTAQFKDIYVVGEEDPRLTADKMLAGDYRDRYTKKIIKRLKDITGPVDDAHTGKVIISIADHKKGLVDKFGKTLPFRILDKIKGFGSNMMKPLNFAKGVGLALYRKLDAIEDVYVKGEDEPRLLASKLSEGKYFDKETKKPIYRVKDISGPVVDETGATMLNRRDIKRGLVNQHGKPITTLFEKAKGLALGGVDLALKAAQGFGKMVWGGATKLGRMALNMKDWFGKGWNKLKGMEFNLGFGIMLNKPVVNKLEEIRILLDTRLPGGKKKKKASNDKDSDGFRDGSAEEQKQEADAEKQAKQSGRMATLLEKLAGVKEKVKGKASEAGTGIMGLFSGMRGLMGNLGDLLGGFTKFLPAATTMMTILSKVKNIPGMVMGAGAAIKGAVTGGFLGKAGKVLGGVGRFAMGAGRLLMGGTGMLLRGALTVGGAVLSSPALLTAAAVALAGYAAYKIYEYATKEDDYLLRWRMVQYGIDPDEEELVKKILTAESLLLKNIQVSKNKTAKFGAGVKFGQLMDVFGVKEEDEVHMERFLGWLKYRFKPVFLSTVTIYFDITSGSSNILEADQKLTTDQSVDLVKKSHFPLGTQNSPYAWKGLPFTDPEETDYDEDDIDDEYNDTLEDLEDDREKRDQRAQSNQSKTSANLKGERDKKQKEKDDSLTNRAKNSVSNWWEKTKGGASALLDKTKDVASKAWNKIKGWKDGAVDATSRAMEAGIKGAKAGWKWMETKGSELAQGVGDGVNSAVEFAKKAGHAIIPKNFSANANAVMQSLLTVAKQTGIAANPAALAMFLAQMYHESGGFKTMSENLNYRVDTLMKISKRAQNAGRAAVDQVVKAGPVAIAEFMYGGRMGNNAPGDGWKYRGRGPTQLTGKDNYAAAGKALGLDLLNNPDLVAEPEVGARVAAWFWNTRVGSKGASGDVTAVTKVINGGTNGLADRAEAFRSFLQRVKEGTIEVGAGMASAMTGVDVEGKPTQPAPKVGTAPGAKSTMHQMGVTAGNAAKKQDNVVAQHKQAEVAKSAAAATSQAAATKAATSTDSAIVAGLNSLLKTNQDQLLVLRSIESKMDKFAGGASAAQTAAAKAEEKAAPTKTTNTNRSNSTAPVKMGSL